MNQLLATQITTIHGDKAWIEIDELKKAYLRIFGQPPIRLETDGNKTFLSPPFEVTCHTPDRVRFTTTQPSATQELTMQEMMNAIAGC